MAEPITPMTSPESRLDLARILKANGNCVQTTLCYLSDLHGLDDAKQAKLELILRRIRDMIRTSKKSLESLHGDWWHSEICSELFIASQAPQKTKSVRQKKELINLSLQHQRSRISSVLESIRSISVIEKTSEITIAALALQLLCNEEDNREVARVSKSIVQGKFSGQFGRASKSKELDVDKAIFLLDLLEIGKRKYTLLRQLLLSNEIHFPTYQRVADHRNNLVLRSMIQLYPNPTAPVGVCVCHTLNLSTIHFVELCPLYRPLQMRIFLFDFRLLMA
ncbi:hypothetical protein LOD99_3139 [Oopsacas minuta]|uniref:Uncharacterized protein n=1 Tax=Oopsacas minuta TaxID=111878 RepID=A0AAV7JZ64_9METZ|nr:hypothetical protein LOD99_3139 [Oopsacas minuta]